VGPRAVLDAVVKRKIPSPCQELKPKTLIVQPVASVDYLICILNRKWCHVLSMKIRKPFKYNSYVFIRRYLYSEPWNWIHPAMMRG
jgi:hypothetical protein